MADPNEIFEIFDEHNKLIGTEKRGVVHKKGACFFHVRVVADVFLQGYYHRSVHILVWNDKRELLLQKRSDKKDVCPGMWDVSVRAVSFRTAVLTQGSAQSIFNPAKLTLLPLPEVLCFIRSRRLIAVSGLREELGVHVSEAQLKCVKPAKLHVTEVPDKGIADREFNETYELHWNGDLKLDHEEVAGVRWITLPALRAEMGSNPKAFTTWFAADYALLLAST